MSDYPPPFRVQGLPADGHVTPSDPQYAELMSCSYAGFASEPKRALAEEVHARFRGAFDGLQRAAFYQYDLTQPQGAHTARRPRSSKSRYVS